MITTLLFDLDNTVLNFDSGEKAALNESFRAFDIEPTEELLEEYHHINIKYWEKLERGELSRIEVLEGRFDELFEKRGISCTGRQIQSTYEHALANYHDFMPGAEETLEALSGRYDMYIISNGCAEIQAQRIWDARLTRFFKDFFVSENIGFDKPDKRFFDYCAEHIPNFQPENALVIGDSLTSDIRGGNNAGIKTCLLSLKKNPNFDTVRPDFMIFELSELEKLLHNLA
ncbi:MAG: YjjG family noncanonical pyrimidine nucleotidase [Eubacteriales bacterium]|nr:YjjG family noncanonical pyrimidine nucleotidase [Eubacteriales bacterium]